MPKNRMVSIRIPPRQARRMSRYLGGLSQGIPIAISRAVSDTTNKSRVAIVRAVAADLNVQVRKLYQRNSTRRPITQKFLRGATGRIMGGHIAAAGDADASGFSAKTRIGRIPLAKGRFNARGLKRPRGVSYKIKKDAPRKRLVSRPDDIVFWATMRSGYEGAFTRKAGRVIALHGPSVPHVTLERPKVKKILKREGRRMFIREIDRQISVLMRTGRPGRRRARA